MNGPFYVDAMDAPYGRMIMCHLIGPNDRELKEFAKLIKVDPKWIQYPQTYKAHFDISKGAKQRAIKAGAIEITTRQLARMLRQRKKEFADYENWIHTPA